MSPNHAERHQRPWSIHLGRDGTHWDLVLVSRHESETALAEYIAHPLHIEVAKEVAVHVAQKAIIDSLV
ncbi:hypothetical protein J2Y41_001015 [Arthrobacter sp. 1088]|nr:hypothetical protein [Arthrobacter sp. 1088]